MGAAQADADRSRLKRAATPQRRVAALMSAPLPCRHKGARAVGLPARAAAAMIQALCQTTARDGVLFLKGN